MFLSAPIWLSMINFQNTSLSCLVVNICEMAFGGHPSSLRFLKMGLWSFRFPFIQMIHDCHILFSFHFKTDFSFKRFMWHWLTKNIRIIYIYFRLSSDCWWLVSIILPRHVLLRISCFIQFTIQFSICEIPSPLFFHIDIRFDSQVCSCVCEFNLHNHF